MTKNSECLAQALPIAEREYRKGRYDEDPSSLLNACLLLSKASRDLATKTLQLGLKKFPGHPLLRQELQALEGKPAARLPGARLETKRVI
jgi:hypothetical protein